MKATGIVRRIDDLGRVVIRRKSDARCVSARATRHDNIDTVRKVPNSRGKTRLKTWKITKRSQWK